MMIPLTYYHLRQASTTNLESIDDFYFESESITVKSFPYFIEEEVFYVMISVPYYHWKQGILRQSFPD